ncbi:C2H2 type zinc finger domain-containing protein [Colletotrichum sojae]|uniref:C2H2 type zinc finger domain-containing protein n=1 Tax=Colletotrichum sojae TaxID=2175907 RepID=A0A8H6ILE7_9PEZI|nr:C2H2 type zinc finger domain-containing protein [Colletotrichum sojae]
MKATTIPYSPQMQAHRPKRHQPFPSPPPFLRSVRKPTRGRRRVEPLQGDAVLLAHLGNGIQPDIPLTNGLPPLPLDSDSESEPLPRRGKGKAGDDAKSAPKLRLKPRPGASFRPDVGPCHSTISKDCAAGEGARQAEMLASLGRRLRVNRQKDASRRRIDSGLGLVSSPENGGDADGRLGMRPGRGAKKAFSNPHEGHDARGAEGILRVQGT